MEIFIKHLLTSKQTLKVCGNEQAADHSTVVLDLSTIAHVNWSNLIKIMTYQKWGGGGGGGEIVIKLYLVSLESYFYMLFNMLKCPLRFSLEEN